MKCDNYEDGKCRYYKMLQGTGEPFPTGTGEEGECNPFEDCDSDWMMVENEDCDMLDMNYDDEDEGEGE